MIFGCTHTMEQYPILAGGIIGSPAAQMATAGQTSVHQMVNVHPATGRISVRVNTGTNALTMVHYAAVEILLPANTTAIMMKPGQNAHKQHILTASRKAAITALI